MFILVFIFIAILIGMQFYYGKLYKPCKKCEPNEYFIFKINQLPSHYIEELYNRLKNGTRLKNERNFNSVQGRKISKETVPGEIKDFFLTEQLRLQVSEAVGETVYFADDVERYKIFARLYEDGGDHIDWHYDNNYTDGNRYTLVVPIIQDATNTSEFMIKDQKTRAEQVVPVHVGQGVVYNGSITYHKITPQTEGSTRMVIIIPFYSNKNISFLNRIRMNLRNVIFKNLTL